MGGGGESRCGAVVFTLMDTAMGAARMSVVEEEMMCAAIEIHTRFRRGRVPENGAS